MESARSMLAAVIIFFGLIAVILSFTDKSFTLENAEKRQSTAIERCMEGVNSPDFNIVRHYLELCMNEHPIEKYHYNGIDLGMFLVFGVPTIGALIMGIFAIYFTVFDDPLSSLSSSSGNKPKPKLSSDGSLKIGSGRKQKGEDLLWRDYRPPELWIKYHLLNVEDIIKKSHIMKGDYSKHFAGLAKQYIENGHQSITPQQVIGYLEWAIKTIPKVYTGSSKQTGEKKIEQLKKNISKLESMT